MTYKVGYCLPAIIIGMCVWWLPIIVRIRMCTCGIEIRIHAVCLFPVTITVVIQSKIKKMKSLYDCQENKI